MPTTLPRHSVSFEKETNAVLLSLAEERGVAISTLISEMVTSALQFIEDFELIKLGEERLGSFDRSKALTTEQLISWTRTRKKK